MLAPRLAFALSKPRWMSSPLALGWGACVAGLIGWSATGCFPFGATLPWSQGLRASVASSPRLKSFPPGVAEELVYYDSQIQGVGAIQASGAPEAAAQVNQQVALMAGQIQMVLEEEVPLAVVERCVRALVDDAAKSSAGRQNGLLFASGMRTARASQALLNPVLHPSPEVQAELDRERPAITHVAEVRNAAEASGAGEDEAEEIAARINGRLQQPMDEKTLKFQVLQEATKIQGQVLKKRDGTMMEAITAQSSGPLKAVLERTGKISPEEYERAVRDAFAGNLTTSLPILQRDFERLQAIHELYPWRRYDQSRDSRAYYFGVDAQLNLYLTLADRNPTSAELRALAYKTTLSLRTRNPEVERRISAALATLPSAQAQRNRWFETRNEIATLELQRAAGVVLSTKEERALVELGKKEAELLRELDEMAQNERIKDSPFAPDAGWKTLQASVAPHVAVVSFIRYRRMDPLNHDLTQWPRHYGAFVLTSDELSWVPLGPATDLEPAVDDYLAALGTPGCDLEAKKAKAREFYQHTWSPLVAALGQRDQVTIIPDGSLQLVPFEAAYDGEAWLADRYRISYELTERQLLGEYEPKVPVGPALIVAGGPYSARPKGLRFGERLTRDMFRELPGLDGEVRQVAEVLPSAELVMGTQATDALFMGRRAPRIVHIAAHGVYLPLASGQGPGERGLVVLEGSPPDAAHSLRSVRRARDASAMSRAAIVLSPSDEPSTDGFLTAFEVAAGNLWGTELVVLSACETGRGKPDAARGIQGLRRAFFGVGVNSLVTSLWPVEDRATQDLMLGFYRRLMSGVSRIDALREASRSVRESHRDPTIWAPFVLFGKGSPLPPTDATGTSQPREDGETRFRRAMAQRRLRHSSSPMGTAHWSMAAEPEEAVDAFVARDVHDHQPMTLTLLGRRSSLSLTLADYGGPGRYTGLSARSSVVKDPLTADTRTLHTEGTALELKASTLEVSTDSPKQGFTGRFELLLRDGRRASGEFQLPTGLPPAPAWMLRAMQREGTTPSQNPSRTP
jgi:CHAT domain-containing protein